MKDFKTDKAIKLLEEAQVDGQDIYLNLAAINMLEIAKLSEKIDENNIEVCLQLARMLFTEESYKLVEYMDLADLVELLGIAEKVIDNEQTEVTERFSRAE
jgi:hypothetical protein